MNASGFLLLKKLFVVVVFRHRLIFSKSFPHPTKSVRNVQQAQLYKMVVVRSCRDLSISEVLQRGSVSGPPGEESPAEESPDVLGDQNSNCNL